MQQPSALYLSVHSALPTILSKQALSCVQNLSAQKVLTETLNEQIEAIRTENVSLHKKVDNLDQKMTQLHTNMEKVIEIVKNFAEGP